MSLKIILTFVAELVAVVMTHPTVTVDVAFAVFVTVRVAEPVPPPTVKLPDNAVELAEAFLMVSPLRSVNCVVDAPPRNVARPVTPSVPVSVEFPTTLRLLCNERAPAAVVVAFPPTHKGPPMVADWVVEELVNVLTPVTPSVVENVPEVPERAAMRVSAPAELKVDVAEPPK